ncbi:MAG: DUF5615 family PIN-like protein [Candidatus Baldrarchaeia archaeon]
MSLKFLLDENVPISVYRYLLRIKNYEVEYVPRGSDDQKVAKLAKEKKAILITRDSDFANIVLYPPEEYYGIIVFRIHPPIPDDLIRALDRILEKIQNFEGKTIIVYRNRIEIIR